MQRLDLRSHLFDCQFALNVALIDRLRFVARLKSLQADRRKGLAHLIHAFSPLLLSDLECWRHRGCLRLSLPSHDTDIRQKEQRGPLGENNWHLLAKTA